MRFLAWLLVHTFYRVRIGGAREHARRRPVHRRVQPRELRRRRRHRRLRAAADPLRDGPPDLPHPACSRSSSARCARSRSRRRARMPALKDRAFDEVATGARRRRDRRHLSRRPAHRRRRAQPRFGPACSRSSTTTPVPVVPMALRGLWGSFFSRARTAARRCGGFRGLCCASRWSAATAAGAGGRDTRTVAADAFSRCGATLR